MAPDDGAIAGDSSVPAHALRNEHPAPGEARHRLGRMALSRRLFGGRVRDAWLDDLGLRTHAARARPLERVARAAGHRDAVRARPHRLLLLPQPDHGWRRGPPKE